MCAAQRCPVDYGTVLKARDSYPVPGPTHDATPRYSTYKQSTAENYTDSTVPYVSIYKVYSIDGRSGELKGSNTKRVPLQYLKACGVLHSELEDRVRPAALALGPRHALLLAEQRPLIVEAGVDGVLVRVRVGVGVRAGVGVRVRVRVRVRIRVRFW